MSKRRPNFSADEIEVLLQGVEKHNRVRYFWSLLIIRLMTGSVYVIIEMWAIAVITLTDKTVKAQRFVCVNFSMIDCAKLTTRMLHSGCY